MPPRLPRRSRIVVRGTRHDDLTWALAALIADSSERTRAKALHALAGAYPDFPLTVRLARIALMHMARRAPVGKRSGAMRH